MKTLESLLQPNLNLISQIPGFIVWKDLELKIAMCNDNYLNVTQMRSLDHIQGKVDTDFPWAGATRLIHIGDRKALANEEISLLEVLPLSKDDPNEFLTVISQKKPIKDQQNNTIGMVGSAIEITSKEITALAFRLNQTLSFYTAKPKMLTEGINYYLQSGYNDYQLTRRESECFFYFLQGRTAKEIANILFISRRTVEKHMQNIKQKFHVTKKSALIDIAVAENLLAIIPPSLLRQGEVN